MAAHPLVVSVPDSAFVEALADLEGVDAVVWDMERPHPRGAEIRFAVMPYMTKLGLADVTRGLDALEVVQLQSAGYEQFVGELPDGVTLCNAAGVHDASTAELALTLTLASIRDIPELVGSQGRRHWEPLRLRSALADRRVLVVGYGRIGRAIARRFAPFEVTLTAVASRARAGDELVPHVHGIDELPDLLPDHDVVVVIVPLTDSTRGLVDASLLGRMPDGALLVNVARGPVVDTDALVAECTAGRLRAALDVTDPEPLPEDHPLWTAPGVLITPHVGGATDAMRPRAIALVRRQVEALLAGELVDNAVAGPLSAPQT
ncbi:MULTISPECIES: 2-hydroxyacid dehydrogenase [unclassified Terrabacter]|uniref:2-hydroxyacid dehydrogenase n=1 Tax=unclassified Terrabacter TaxID=2630222 RepID=UPI0006F9004E|nr:MULTISPECIES: 2-hydroxyacid dehydrogenase [unclassified Terrabacter]KRB48157.1 hydroxyacid dehydrogenase [Terrabacter sp. Root181]KRF40660.1 hydroxyacid dehydrogenase [Terrabacter sp. Soil810]